jgi:gliding motility-associated lipoprotein GldH
MARINLNNFGLVLVILFLASCDTAKIYDEYQHVPSEGWLTSNSIDFEIEIEENEGTLVDYLIGLRNNNDYLYSNIFIFADIESPSGIHQRDTLQYLLAEPSGKWIGAGVGAIKHNLFKFKEEQSLETGLYKIKLSHGMRNEVLVGIEDLGFRIERSN